MPHHMIFRTPLRQHHHTVNNLRTLLTTASSTTPPRARARSFSIRTSVSNLTPPPTRISNSPTYKHHNQHNHKNRFHPAPATNPTTTITARPMSTAVSRRLAGKTVLITGASSGIGRATALEFAHTSPSIRLILTARRVSELEALKKEIEEAPELAGKTQVWIQKLDVSNPEEVRGLLQALPEGWREVDVLVNNAGLVKGTEHVGTISLGDIQTMLHTNVLGLILLTNLLLPGMLQRNLGDIINVGSIAGREGYAGGSIYCATKAAVRAFTESLRKETISSRVRIIEVDPGQVLTEFSVVRFRGDREKADKVYEGCEPLTPADVAEVIVFSAGRRENVVVAETLLFPNHQAAAGVLYRKPVGQ